MYALFSSSGGGVGLIGWDKLVPKRSVSLFFLHSQCRFPKEWTPSWDWDGAGIGVSLSEDEGETGMVCVIGLEESERE